MALLPKSTAELNELCYIANLRVMCRCRCVGMWLNNLANSSPIPIHTHTHCGISECSFSFSSTEYIEGVYVIIITRNCCESLAYDSAHTNKKMYCCYSSAAACQLPTRQTQYAYAYTIYVYLNYAENAIFSQRIDTRTRIEPRILEAQWQTRTRSDCVSRQSTIIGTFCTQRRRSSSPTTTTWKEWCG